MMIMHLCANMCTCRSVVVMVDAVMCRAWHLWLQLHSQALHLIRLMMFLEHLPSASHPHQHLLPPHLRHQPPANQMAVLLMKAGPRLSEAWSLLGQLLLVAIYLLSQCAPHLA